MEKKKFYKKFVDSTVITFFKNLHFWQMLKQPMLNLMVLHISVFPDRPLGGVKYVQKSYKICSNKKGWKWWRPDKCFISRKITAYIPNDLYFWTDIRPIPVELIFKPVFISNWQQVHERRNRFVIPWLVAILGTKFPKKQSLVHKTAISCATQNNFH